VNIRLPRKKAVDPIESGSLSDLAFLLIIYFIVIAGFNVNAGFLLNVPAKDSRRVVNTRDLLKLRLDASGAFSLDGRQLDLEAAELALTDAVTAKPNLTVLLSIDPECPWQQVVDAVAAAQRSKAENFSFRMEGGS